MTSDAETSETGTSETGTSETGTRQAVKPQTGTGLPRSQRFLSGRPGTMRSASGDRFAAAPDEVGVRHAPLSGEAARWLIVLCHGIGADGRQLDRLRAAWARAVPDAAFLAPHAPRRHGGFPLALLPARLRRRGREWFSLADRTLQAQAPAVQAAAARLDAIVDDELRRLDLPADACALMGYSQGAIVALLAGLRRDAPPRAVVSLSGGLSPLGAFAAELESRVPVLLLHGANDRVVPPHVSERAERLLVARAIPAIYRPLPATAHDIDEAGISAGAAFIRRMLA